MQQQENLLAISGDIDNKHVSYVTKGDFSWLLVPTTCFLSCNFTDDVIQITETCDNTAWLPEDDLSELQAWISSG